MLHEILGIPCVSNELRPETITEDYANPKALLILKKKYINERMTEQMKEKYEGNNKMMELTEFIRKETIRYNEPARLKCHEKVERIV